MSNRVDVKNALEQAERIIDTIEELSDSVKDKAPEFFEDVLLKVKSVAETIERRDNVTDKQANALDGWEKGVSRWVHE